MFVLRSCYCRGGLNHAQHVNCTLFFLKLAMIVDLGHVYMGSGETNFCTDKNLHSSTLRLHGTGGIGRIFECLSVQVWDMRFFRSQTCTLSHSKIRPVLPVPCKCKVEPCKFLSVQKFVQTHVNMALESVSSI